MGSEDIRKVPDIFVVSKDKKEDTALKKQKPSFHINVELLRFKLHYFLYIGAVAGPMPYIVIFATDRVGISASSLGVVLISQMFLFIFTKPIIGYIADYFNKLKLIISALIIISGTCYFLLLTIPKIELATPTGTTDAILDLKSHAEECEKYEAFLQAATIAQTEIRTTGQERPGEGQTCSECVANNITSCANVCAEYFLNQSFSPQNFSAQESINMTLEKHYNMSGVVVLFVKEIKTAYQICVCDEYINCQHFTTKETPQSQMNSTEQMLNGQLLIVRKFDEIHQVLTKWDKKNILLDKSYEIDNLKPTKDFQTYQFWAFAIILTICNICANAIFTLSDTACIETLQKTGAEFGKQRLWGGIGWGIIAPISGLLHDYTHDYLSSWILTAVMLLLFLWNISKLDLLKPHFSQNILRDVGTVFRSKEFLVYEVVILMNGIGAGMIWFYLVLFLTSIGASKLLCGLSLTVQSFLGVIPFMFFSGWIIKKVGHFNCLLLALCFTALRFAWYSQLNNPWLVLPIEFTHGITYGLYYAALASYGKSSSKPGTEATTQSVIFSTHDGLGAGMGCVLAGVGFDALGGHRAFLCASLFMFGGLALAVLLSFLLWGRKRLIKISA